MRVKWARYDYTVVIPPFVYAYRTNKRKSILIVSFNWLNIHRVKGRYHLVVRNKDATLLISTKDLEVVKNGQRTVY